MHAIGVTGIGNELAVDPANPDCADWSLEWNVGNAQRCGSAVDRQNIRIILAIGAEQNGNDLGVVKVALGKERTQWPVSHARGERLLLRGTSFAFEVTARKFSCRRRFLAVIDGEREEILAFLNDGSRDGARHYHGFAARNYDRTVGQFRDLACFNIYRIGAYLRRDLVLHFLTFWMCENPGRSP